MIDPELNYCPDCRDEYRADIERCGVCGMELVNGKQFMNMNKSNEEKRAARKGDLTPDDEVVNLQAGPLGDMRHLEDLLKTERIGTMIIGDERNCGKGCCPSNFFLQVRKEDAPDAYAIIQAEHQRMTAMNDHDDEHIDNIFNADAGQATCPACGFSFQTSTSTCPDCGLCFG